MNFADLIGNSGIIKDALCRGGFASVDMSHYPDISCFIKLYISVQSFSSLAISVKSSTPFFYEFPAYHL
jgi:hypothetical protein